MKKSRDFEKTVICPNDVTSAKITRFSKIRDFTRATRVTGSLSGMRDNTRVELGLRDPFRACGTIHSPYTARVPFGNAAWDTRIPGGGELGLRVGYAWGPRVTRGLRVGT